MIPHNVEALYEAYPEYKLVETNNGIEIEYADALWPLAHPLDIELGAYRVNWQDNSFKHLKKAHHIAWPQLVPTWHDWSEDRFYEFCQPYPIMTWAGGANIGKSVDAACIALLFWWANCRKRTVLVGSTTITDLDNRIFGYIKKYHDTPQQYGIQVAGELYTSAPPMIITNKKDTIHGIYAVALLKGNKENKRNGQKSSRSSNLIGRHPEEGFLAIIDEGPDVSPAFMDAMSNWDKAPLFKCIVIGNSSSMYDPHGLLSTPLHGWDSINPDTDSKWLTKNGVCLYFDCYRSPAITERDPEKKMALSVFLPTPEKIETDKVKYGDNSPEFWRMTRGFWAPEDVTNTILSALSIDKHQAKAKPEWSGEAELTRIAMLDPAFSYGGDAIVLRFADFGKDIKGRWLIDFGGRDFIHYIRVDARSIDPIDYQIVKQAKLKCREAGVLPVNTVVDVTGTGMGLGSIIQKEWSKEILLVASNEGCSDLPIMQGNLEITAKDVYDRKVTELWFMFQRFILSGQVRGLDDLTCQQLCTRQYDRIGKKLSIETKVDYKHRLGKVDSRYRSPDESDAATIGIELVRHRYGISPHSQLDVSPDVQSGWRKFFESKRVLEEDGSAEDSVPQHFFEESSGSEQSWEDGFSVDQFSVDFEENEVD